VGVHDRFEYLHEVKHALESFPGTTFVWAHCGISRRVGHKLYHRMVEEMLSEHHNLFVDISWVVYDQTVCSRHVPKKCWTELIGRHPDRFMLGSDLCGHFELLGKTMGRYNVLLESLPGSTREMVACGNASGIWRL
jgi:predicted TIM-barrel fold metal-dependent hydrolase